MIVNLESETAEVLPKAAPPEMAKLTPQELEKIELAEESTMRSLRLFLRDVLTRLAQDRRFKVEPPVGDFYLFKLTETNIRFRKISGSVKAKYFGFAFHP